MLSLVSMVFLERPGSALGFWERLFRLLLLVVTLSFLFDIERADRERDRDALFLISDLQPLDKFMLDQEVIDKFPPSKDYREVDARLVEGVIPDKRLEAGNAPRHRLENVSGYLTGDVFDL